MPLAHEHELHRRRLGRNIGLGVVLAAFVALIFALTVVKIGHLPDQASPGETRTGTEDAR